jgi:glutathione peroxidase
MTTPRILLALALVACLATARADEPAPAAPAGPLDFTMNKIDGTPVDLSVYAGKVVMIVNVASKCGNTKQYKPLQAIYETYKDRGLVILAFPANNFGGQEPGTNLQIVEFCETKFGVTFDLFEKVSVKGEDICPLYAYLTSKDAGHDFGGEIQWNFDKFLIGRDGQIIERLKHKTQPDAPEVIASIEAALGPAPDAPEAEAMEAAE